MEGAQGGVGLVHPVGVVEAQAGEGAPGHGELVEEVAPDGFPGHGHRAGVAQVPGLGQGHRVGVEGPLGAPGVRLAQGVGHLVGLALDQVEAEGRDQREVLAALQHPGPGGQPAPRSR